ncbi:hypothetical protein C9399_00280 [Xanthomonas vasicola pv. vasculorum]|nr:hypothetical protein C9399_00280 [Xanthomonas vasicola pv. vasculorum]
MSCDSVIGFWQFKRGRDRTRSPAWGAAHRCRVPRHRQSARILAPARSACRSRRATRPHATEDARHPIVAPEKPQPPNDRKALMSAPAC